ncbi:MAG: sigma 54-interacting transcriptional regulator [Myxococcota bacterium]
MVEWLGGLSRRLRTHPAFEERARAVLETMFARISRAIHESEYRDHGRVLRTWIHYRPAGYEGLVVYEPSSTTVPDPTPSATAWHYVSTTGSAVAIDVNLGLVQVGDLSVQDSSNALTEQSQVRLLKRDATHLFAVPLFRADGEVVGLLSAEASCQQALGRDFVWPRCQQDILLLGALAGPWVVRAQPEPEVSGQDPLLPVVGKRMHGLMSALRAFARQDDTLLLYGPSGAGKSRLARWCHHHSPRVDGPFEVVDLMSAPSTTQLAELYGWKKGAFTGAFRDQDGAVVRAAGGTLFLDEVDKLSLAAQAGLLRLLEERQFRPLGDAASSRQADVRFIVGTNANLKAAVSEGRFREDLYFRLSVLPFEVPSLGERKDEIEGWAKFFVARRGKESDVSALIDEGAVDLLSDRPWPGNLRELDNSIRRAFALAAGDSGESPVVVRAVHAREALGFLPSPTPDGSLETVLRQAASAFVDRAIDGKLELEHVDAIRALILQEAERRTGSREEALRLLGKEQAIKSRNVQRLWKKEEEALKRLQALGVE